MSNDSIVSKYSWTSFPLSVDPEHFRGMIYASPDSEHIIWQKAFLDPVFSSSSTDADAGKVKYIYETQDTKDRRVVIAGEKMSRKYEYAQMEMGDIVITSMQDELPLSDHDLIIPVGREAVNVNFQEDARTFSYKQLLTRGRESHAMSGTVSSSAAAVAGSGTRFLTQIHVGDFLEANKKSIRVVSVETDNILHLESIPVPAWNSNVPTRRYERLTKNTAQRLRDARDSSRGYNIPFEARIGSDMNSILWTGGVTSPDFGVTYYVFR